MRKKVIIVGVNGFGETWIKPIKENNLEVVAIVDIDQDAREKGKHLYNLNDGQIFDSSDYSWCNIEADIVLECTPPNNREERIIRALKSGKHVIVAKPPTIALEDLHSVINIQNEENKKVFIATQKRYLPAFQKVKELIDNNVLGEFVYGDINLRVDGTFWKTGRVWRKRMPLPSLIDGSIHHFDLIKWWTDLDIENITSTSWNPKWSPFNNDADFSAVIKLKNNAVIHYNSRWSHKHGTIEHYFSGIRLEFDKGIIEISNGKVYLNDEYIPVIDDGETLMDLELLNIFLLKDILESIDNNTNDKKLMIQNHIIPFKGVLCCVASILNKREVAFRELDQNLEKVLVDKSTFNKSFEGVFDK